MGAPALSKEQKAKTSSTKKNNSEYNEKRRACYKKSYEKRKKKDVFLLPERISSKDSTSNQSVNIQSSKDIERKRLEDHMEVDDISYAADLEEREGIIYDLQPQKGQYIRRKYQ